MLLRIPVISIWQSADAKANTAYGLFSMTTVRKCVLQPTGSHGYCVQLLHYMSKFTDFLKYKYNRTVATMCSTY